jgi:hypothetical protein
MFGNELLLLMLVGNSALWAVAGWRICASRHRQHGMEVDAWFDTPADLWPGGIVVPDDPRSLVDA